MILANNEIQTGANNDMQNFIVILIFIYEKVKIINTILIIHEGSYSYFDMVKLLLKRRQVMQGICLFIQKVYWKKQQP